MTALLVYSLKSALVLTLLYLPYTLMLRRDSFFRMNRLTLLAIMVLALLLPQCNIASLAINDQPVVFEVYHQVTHVIYAETAASAELSSASSFSWGYLCALIYIIGVAVALVVRLCQLVRIGRIVRNGSLWNEKQKEATIYCHIGDVAPFSWMRNIVISENDLQKEGSREILLHEKAHILCRHSYDILLLMIVEILQWWNPVVYMLSSSLRDVHEFEADDHVLQQGISLSNYQALLVRKAQASSSYAFANNFNHSLIKKRIYMMSHRKSNPWQRSKVLYILPMTIVVLSVFATPKLNETVERVVEKATQAPQVAPRSFVRTDELQKGQQQRIVISSDRGNRKTETLTNEVDSSAVEGQKKTTPLVDAVNESNYRDLTQTPEFPGGMKALRTYVQQHVDSCLQAGTLAAGKQVFVQFRINKDGTIDNVGLLQGDDEAFREAVKMIQQMPRWNAGRRQGLPDYGYFVLNVNYGSK